GVRPRRAAAGTPCPLRRPVCRGARALDLTLMDRRRFMLLAPAALAPASLRAALPRRPVPQLPQGVPPIGMGTWLTFDVGSDDPPGVAQRREVLERFFAAGGGVIDSSPMYGQAERLLGQLLPAVPHEGRLVTETKVWTPFEGLGPAQLE